jgi:hypothetical protein
MMLVLLTRVPLKQHVRRPVHVMKDCNRTYIESRMPSHMEACTIAVQISAATFNRPEVNT